MHTRYAEHVRCDGVLALMPGDSSSAHELQHQVTPRQFSIFFANVVRSVQLSPLISTTRQHNVKRHLLVAHD